MTSSLMKLGHEEKERKEEDVSKRGKGRMIL